MRALITGAAGQDGWYLGHLLASSGYEVFGLVSADDAAGELAPGVRPIRGDLTDAHSLRSALAEVNPDEIYNLASISSVARSWRDPALVADVNGTGVARMLALVHEASERGMRSPRFVQASSAEIFGAAPAPQDERTPIAPRTPYGAAKAYAHHAVAAYRDAGCWASSVILFNHESPRRPDTFVTAKIANGVARIAAGGRDPLVLGNLEARRDWGFAGDHVRAMALVGQQQTPADFVVATGVSHTTADFVAAAFGHVGVADWRPWVKVDPGLQRAGDSIEQRGDASRARECLGWQPTVGFEQLVAMMVDAALEKLTRTR